MNLSSLPDPSLYEIALQAQAASTPLQISPATFKSVISTTIDLLLEQQIQAVLWVKLPRTEAWYGDIKRYCSSGLSAQPIHVLHYQKEEGIEDLVPEPPQESGIEDGEKGSTLSTPPKPKQDPLINGGGIAGNSLESWLNPQNTLIGSVESGPEIIPIPLTSSSQLRREYFLLVISERFCSLLLGHRPRSMQLTRPDINLGQAAAIAPRSSSTGLAQNSSFEEEVPERKQPLLAIYSFQGPILAQVLQRIRQVMLPEVPDPDVDLLVSDTGIVQDAEGGQIHWNTFQAICAAHQPDPNLLNAIASKQVQHYEELWNRTTLYRRQAEAMEGLQLQNEALASAIRLKDEFLSNVGQELRTPLTNMKTALTLLNSPQLKPAQRQRYMQLLSTECDRQGSLISSLQDLVQLEHAGDNMSMQALHLNDILPGVVSTYQPLAQEKGVMLAYTIPESLPPVSCLSTWVKQIAINLIHNGIKFTPTGGQVWVRAKQQGDYLQLEFRDTGIGIPLPEIPKIFDRFYRVRQVEDYGGAGLGLTIVQQILLRCGGSISVKSKPGEGSTFNVLLPIYKNAGESTGPLL
ncbi:hypothetical protein BST81_03730 [Leptolyngbya sp. 'hensonii']|uniref:ATP-binding protein n=1 Tax=Leptolyngbya sp. 'hensonii' TaxID=1922337 RepID=UPI00094FC6E7|nr:ATP-binding protein [Leptolyngbya sp. 'hensonii']OLP19663.1 hypothetical protein BST81_03730 [Leptolyngbya sp. 'hensonii']